MYPLWLPEMSQPNAMCEACSDPGLGNKMETAIKDTLRQLGKFTCGVYKLYHIELILIFFGIIMVFW